MIRNGLCGWISIGLRSTMRINLMSGKRNCWKKNARLWRISIDFWYVNLISISPIERELMAIFLLFFSSPIAPRGS